MNNLQIIEFKNQRILTTEQLVEVCQTDGGNITDNFGNNKQRFGEGKHYFFLKGEELKAFKRYTDDIGVPINKFASQLVEEVEVLKIYSSRCMDCDFVEHHMSEILWESDGLECPKCQGTVHVFYNGNREEGEGE